MSSSSWWIESHVDLRDHPKTDALTDLLAITRRDAIGLLHLVWWRAMAYAPSGDLSEFTDGQIARWADWDGDPGHLVAGLMTAGFLDSRRTLHDWHDYAGRWIDRRAADAKRKKDARAASAGRVNGARPGMSGGHPPGHRPESGVPNLTGPNLTGPNLTGPDRTEPPPPTPPATAREGGGALPRAHTPRKEKVVLNGRDGAAGCPAGCPTNHGGPSAGRYLGEDWLASPPDDRPAWPEFLTRHGRRDLADVPAPAPVQQEA
jgi:hypothetical protein